VHDLARFEVGDHTPCEMRQPPATAPREYGALVKILTEPWRNVYARVRRCASDQYPWYLLELTLGGETGFIRLPRECFIPVSRVPVEWPPAPASKPNVGHQVKITSGTYQGRSGLIIDETELFVNVSMLPDGRIHWFPRERVILV